LPREVRSDAVDKGVEDVIQQRRELLCAGTLMMSRRRSWSPALVVADALDLAMSGALSFGVVGWLMYQMLDYHC
jgi:hypothetical protein